MLDAQNIDPDQIIYLTEFKQKLNEHIAKETEKRQKEIESMRKKGKVPMNVEDPEFIRQTFSHVNGRRGGMR